MIFDKPQTIRIYDKPVIITIETIKTTCQWYADNSQGCIDEAKSGKVFVNDLESYTLKKLDDKQRYLSGDFEPWLGFWQQAYYIQTSESIPLFEN